MAFAGSAVDCKMMINDSIIIISITHNIIHKRSTL